jgi:nicotinamidase-related amidase
MDAMSHTAGGPALLIIDVQLGFDDPKWGRRNNPNMEAHIVELLAAWRGAGRPVLHARHMSTEPGSPLRPGQRGNDFKIDAKPRPDEPVIEKRVNSCFIGTALDEHLRSTGIQSLVIAGLTTNHCVSTTARMAGNMGYGVCVVSDATATFDRRGPDGVLYPAEVVHAVALADLNGEFGAVRDTRTLIEEMRRSA